MRWPWQREPVETGAIEGQIEEQAARSNKVLQRARRLLSAAIGDIDRAERMIVDDYARAEQERRK